MGCGSLGVILIGTIFANAETYDIEKAMNRFEVLPGTAWVDSCDNHKSLSLLEPTDTISAIDLVEEFNNNAVTTTQKYSGQDLVVEGEVVVVNYDMFGDPYIAIGSPELFGFNTVWCMVSGVSNVEGISTGDNARMQGTFFEWDGIDVILKPCALEP